MILSIVDQFVPPRLGKELGERTRARTLVGILLANAVLLLLLNVPLLLSRSLPNGEMSRGHGLLFGIAAFYLGLAWLFRRTGSFSLVGNLFCLQVFLSAVALTAITGGIAASGIVHVLIIIPVVAFILVSQRWGMIWLVLVLAVTSLFVAADGVVSGWQRITLTNTASANLMVAFVSTLTVAACLSVYALLNRRLVDLLELDRNRFAFQAVHDSLTELTNRVGFDAFLESSIEGAEERGERFAVLYLDLDNFKPINDSLGHAVGDEVLQIIGQRLRNIVRESDVVARLGGDEFAVILRSFATDQDAVWRARKILAAVGKPISVSVGEVVSVEASVGVVMYPLHTESRDELLKLADAAMFYAKRRRLGIHVYDIDVTPGEELNYN